MRDIHISIVSHSQAILLRPLLLDLERLACRERLQLTLTKNLPENLGFEHNNFSYPVSIIENARPLGFAANHNQAFRQPLAPPEREFFFVLNPDLRLENDIFELLIEQLQSSSRTGVIAPRVFTPNRVADANARLLPTPIRLFRKLFGSKGEWPLTRDCLAFPDWVAGMFLGFRAEVYEAIGGFDETYFLYYEDVELCSRLWLHGYEVGCLPAAGVLHNAQRLSHKTPVYFFKHVRSMLKFFGSKTYRQVKRLHKTRNTKSL